ncbi:MAG: glycosyltransferase [Paramuribaculum sp.]|nr:glycosyltransferase [Paramuribaculum sp.]
MVAVSVIVPFHNAELTLEAALESLLLQKCREEVEFILVNDGSTDHSEEVVKYFFALHPDFEEKSILVNSPFRQGVATAYSLGLNNARGEFLARLDSDDTFCADAIDKMLAVARCDNADIVCGKMNKHYPGKQLKQISPSKLFGDLNYMPLNTVNFSLCNKLVKRSLLLSNEILPMPGIDCWDDVNILSRAFSVSSKSVAINDTVYNYTIDDRAVSLSNTRHDLAMRQRLMCCLLVEKWFTERSLANRYEEFILLLKFHAKIKLLRGEYCDITKWRETYPEVNLNIMKIKQLPLGLRLGFYVLNILPVMIGKLICGAVDKFVRR